MKDVLYDEILPSVSKPSRYLGTEYNAVRKDPTEVDLRVALVFPDLYDLGLGNLGVHILYAILNDLPWCWAERAYAPAPDMENALRARGLPIFALESKDPLGDLDLIGFSLQSELTYTNVLNVIDLAGLPLRSQDRDDRHPLVFAGGPTALNPEPMAPFIDFFVIGDGEEAVVEIAEIARETRAMTRNERLEAVAAIPGVYVPALYPIDHLPNGAILPSADAPKIVRRVVEHLDDAPFPTNYIVPYTQLIHDRIGLEILRGCSHGCRFCQAGMANRPVRTRSLETLDALAGELLGNTGYEEMSLLSLSTCDYPRIRTLLRQSTQRAQAGHVAVSAPSLRLDTFSVELADAVTGVRRSGLTFAPEVATRRLRAVVNKIYEDGELLDVAAEAFRRGWNHIKLYFMIGLPTERDEDVEAIADLCLRVLKHGRAINARARVFTGISTLVPKPFTPFQWAAQIGREEIERRQHLLKSAFGRNQGIKFGRHESESTYIEGLIARGDRRVADVIEAAFRKGARLESSSEYLQFHTWLQAVEETGYDANESFRERALDERLPWDHLDVLIPKTWLQDEWAKAVALEETPDCRREGCHHCGLSQHVPELCSAMRSEAKQGAQNDDAAPTKRLAPPTEPPAVQRLRFRIGRTDEARFLSNLETMSAWTRILRRAKAPLSYSQGFHAHPKVAFATAPPVGEESEGDYMDVTLREHVNPQEMLGRVLDTLPPGFHAYEAKPIALSAPSLMSQVAGFDYTIRAQCGEAALRQRIEEVLAADALPIERKGRPTGRRKKNVVRSVDLRPMIRRLAVREVTEEEIVVELSTAAADGRMAKPREILDLLGLDPQRTRVRKLDTHLGEESDP
ncbi:MAG: TIGR03960 family B12-binding radical SAM protein [Nitrospiraceae bacterium]|nr:TIGR03960 family B12-binding radical SAM protein [Nitrospiraceae bacterium]